MSPSDQIAFSALVVSAIGGVVSGVALWLASRADGRAAKHDDRTEALAAPHLMKPTADVLQMFPEAEVHQGNSTKVVAGQLRAMHANRERLYGWIVHLEERNQTLATACKAHPSLLADRAADAVTNITQAIQIVRIIKLDPEPTDKAATQIAEANAGLNRIAEHLLTAQRILDGEVQRGPLRAGAPLRG